VDYELSDDQRALQSAAGDLLDALASTERIRASAAADEPFDGELWKSVVEQGWLGLELEEADGGLGLSMVEAAAVLEQSGGHAAPAPILDGLVALAALARGEAAEAAEWARRVADGDAIACLGWSSEPTPYAPCADLAIVVAGDDLLAVPLDERPRREPAMDLTRPLGWLRVDATAGIRLGGADAVARHLDRAATARAAEMLGAAQRVLDMSVEYAKQRVQFDRPIGSFQAVKHRCADMLVDVEGMRSVAYWAAWCIAAGHHDASVASSSAKAWCSDASKRVMASALQVHGGIGFTWEHDLHLFLKRAQLDQISFGDAGYHRDRLASLLRARLQAGETVL
jgi:alkylation response protein AidB-like acyl-CoA dehydrogenase